MIGDGGPARDVIVLGSTGSVGRQTLEVIAAAPGRFRVLGLTAHRNVDLLLDQARQTGARRIALADPAAARAARVALDAVADAPEVLEGMAGVAELAGTPVTVEGADRRAEVVLNAIVGSAGLEPTLAVLTAGSRLALANKESLVAAGPLVMDACRRRDQITPVDSEHAAIAQCMRAGRRDEVARVVLTASGGPFRGWSRAQMAQVTVAQALAHPTWAMGPVISVNSATMANKGLEVLEAQALFGVDLARIEVLVHPQSFVHGLVEFADGAVIAQLSPPDMRLPIGEALSWPQRVAGPARRVNWPSLGPLEFAPVDTRAFPMLALARAAGEAGGTAPAVFNAANEAAVQAFVDNRLDFLGIDRVVEAVLAQHEAEPVTALDQIMMLDRRVRAIVAQHVRTA